MSTNHNVVTVTFTENSEAYQALSVLKRADAEGRVARLGCCRCAAAGRRNDPSAGGRRQHPGLGLAGGSLIGMLVGVLGGPLGVFCWAGE